MIDIATDNLSIIARRIKDVIFGIEMSDDISKLVIWAKNQEYEDIIAEFILKIDDS